MAKSWKGEVIADSSGQWCSNALRFETEQEANVYVRDLASRWLAVREWRTAESDDAPNEKLTRDANGQWVQSRI